MIRCDIEKLSVSFDSDADVPNRFFELKSPMRITAVSMLANSSSEISFPGLQYTEIKFKLLLAVVCTTVPLVPR